MPRSQRIAVAGGTGGIGNHVVDGLLELQSRIPSSIITVIVLTRSIKGEPYIQSPSTNARAEIIPVDYTSISSIAQVLSAHQIDTIISTLVSEPSQFIAAQENLLQAALNVPSVHRFAPSEFAIDSEHTDIPLYKTMKRPILQSLRRAKAERSSSPTPFEFTKFNCGIFTNYFGYGSPKSKPGFSPHGHLKAFPYVVDISTGTADVPGDGNNKICYTTAEDVGRFVAEATQLEKWEEDSTMMGDLVTINEVIAMAERITGKTITPKYNTLEDLQARMDPNPTSWMGNFYLDAFVHVIKGEQPQTSATLNELTSVKPMSVEQFLQKWWGKDE
ncbi:hypothetical protein VKT23_009636 [Stygiomarasmius scandens]|uniref:NmrA-like domain-containing protein n=1 Tax=Marasmiellus scandens TaxID=2682957 RepID=A0ABR1JIG1_9AGAR